MCPLFILWLWMFNSGLYFNGLLRDHRTLLHLKNQQLTTTFVDDEKEKTTLCLSDAVKSLGTCRKSM